ncbi:MAG: GGDEF domain-containing response regulator [Planctomycetota bacterium]|jgi:diguanylate cyclase (GGDEF)-like protein
MTAHPPPSPRVLIVESDLHHARLLADTLIAAGDGGASRDPVIVADGQACLAQRLDEFDAALVEMHLSDMSGPALIEQIRAQDDIPIVLVTGRQEALTSGEAFAVNADEIIFKAGDYVFGIPWVVQKAIRQHQVRQENRRLQDELQAMLSELRVKNLQLEESLVKLQDMAETDPLTGLDNRRKFAELGEVVFGEAVRYDYDLTCGMIDLDHYKLLNDQLGHHMGDRALVIAAAVIGRTLRASDAAARYGGDEFVLLLPHTPVHRAVAVCERIRHQLSLVTSQTEGVEQSLTLSAGVASLKADGPGTLDELLAMADKAMYAAKDAGKDRTLTYASIIADPPPQGE